MKEGQKQLALDNVNIFCILEDAMSRSFEVPDNEYTNTLEPKTCVWCDRTFLGIKDGDELCKECERALDEAELVD